MNKLFGRTAFNAVYFFVAVSCSAWLFHIYGLGSAAVIAVCAAGSLYTLLLCFSLFERCLHKSLFTPHALSKTSARAIRAICLFLPALALSYIASFYAVGATYCWPGGVDRFQSFVKLEYSIFNDSRVSANTDPQVDRELSTYMQHTFAAWAKSHWHPPSCEDSREAILRFRVHRNGEISDIEIYTSSGDTNFDRDALVTLDAVAPPLPNGAPDWVKVQFTFSYNVHGPKPAPVVDNWGTEAFDDGKFYQDKGENAKAAKAYLRSLAIRRSVMKNGDPCLTDVYLALAETYDSMGLIKQSEQYFDEAVSCAEKGVSKRPDYLTHSLSEYAKSAYGSQKYQRVIQLYERVEKLNYSPLDRNALVRLAQSLYVTGQPDRALKLFAMVFEMDKKVPPFGPELMDWERSGLIKLYIKTGKQKKATELMHVALSEASKHGKESKQLRKNLLLEFADSNRQLGEQTERQYLQSTLAEFTATFGQLDPAANAIRSSLASFEISHGNEKRANDLYSHLVNSFGKNDSDRANALFHQGAFYYENKHSGGAERVLREALAIRNCLYKNDDSRISGLKQALVEVLRDQGKKEEANSLSATIVAPFDSNRETVLCDRVSEFENSGKVDRALAVLDDIIEESWKADPQDIDGSRSCNYDWAIRLCRESHNDRRLEQYLKDDYASELKRIGFASRHDLIAFYLEHNQLSVAEELAHKEVEECFTGLKDYFPAYKSEEACKAFMLLAHVKDLQNRKATARYYLERGVALVEPNGRSDCHAGAAGTLAQYIAGQGDLLGAKQLLTNLLDKQLSDPSGGIHFDPIGEFSTSGNFGTQACPQVSYEENGSKRVDPSMYKGGMYIPGPQPAVPLAMNSIDWEAASRYDGDFHYTKAATLIALASLQQSSGEKSDAEKSRSRALDAVQQFVEGCEINPEFKRYDLYEAVFANLPPSQRKEEILARFKAVAKKLAS